MTVWHVTIGNNVEYFKVIADDFIEAGDKAQDEWKRLCGEREEDDSELEREVSKVEKLFDIDVE